MKRASERPAKAGHAAAKQAARTVLLSAIALMSGGRSLAQEPVQPLTAPADRRVDLDFLRYYTGDQLQAALESLAGAYPEFLRLESMGKSRGGRELWVVTLSARDGTEALRKGAVLVVGSSSADDPHGVEMALFTIYDIALNHARDPVLAETLAAATLYLVPCLDPDARALLLEPASDASPLAREVALERNFPAGWNPWDGRAGGPYPLSEPETRALADFLTAHPNVALVQTYSQAPPASPSGAGLVLPPADGAAHAALLARATAQLEEGEDLVAAPAAGLRGGSLLAHVVLDRGALGFTSHLAGRGQGRLPQVQELFGLARRAGSHTLLLTRALPRLRIAAASVTRLRNELWQVDLDVENAGLMETAAPLAHTRRMVLPPGFEVAGGKLMAVAMAAPGEGELRPLPGPASAFALPEIPGGGRVQLRLVVSAPGETTLSLSVSAPRAGAAQGSVTLR